VSRQFQESEHTLLFLSHREAERSVLKDAAPESKEVAKQAVRGQVAAWISVAALYAQTGHTCWAEKCHLQVLRACQSSGLRLDAGKCLLEAGKCQLIRGEWNRAHALFTAAILLFKGGQCLFNIWGPMDSVFLLNIFGQSTTRGKSDEIRCP
jgi:hypothetical protein